MFFGKFIHTLTGKLILTIGTLVIVGSAFFWYFLIKHQETELINNSIEYGYSFVDYVKKSTRYGMLLMRQPLIQETIEAIGSGKGIISVRVFNNDGKITYSSDKKDIGTIFDKNSPMCTSCHVSNGHTKNTPIWSITKGKDSRVMNIVQPIYNEFDCYTSLCHFHSKDQAVLGIIEANLSLALLDKSIRQQGVAITLYVAVFIFVLSSVLGTIFWKFVTTPLNNLSQGMKRVAEGDLDHHLTINRKDEIGELASTFNSMTSDLKKTKHELVEWGNTLEKKVQEKTEAMQRAQNQIMHSEKLASLGRMAAGVAHELNSPLTGIVTFSHIIQKKFTPDTQEYKDLTVIIEQANQCTNIIRGLLGFARASTVEKIPININEVLASSLNIVRNKADFFNIKLNTVLDNSLFPVKADPSKLQQVFLNMIMNAGDAIEGKGEITITTRNINEGGNNFVEIEFTDTGMGISQNNLERLFEPFFTTKPAGKGTGLGLAVSHGIIKEHSGNISVRTKLGEGTSFIIKLPVDGEKV